MARESCNLDKEEAELLKPSSPSSSSSPTPAAAATPPSSLFLNPPQEPPRRPETDAACDGDGSPQVGKKEAAPPQGRSARQCFSCRRRVGLTGWFRCRCGEVFCSRHRHAAAHGCWFDYKAAGREEISRANPVIRAAKIIKI